MLESWKSEQWALAICILSGGLLCIGLVMEHAMGLSPCPLCMMQRIWLALVGLTAYASLAHSPRWGIYPLVGGVFAIIGSGFHCAKFGYKTCQRTRCQVVVLIWHI